MGGAEWSGVLQIAAYKGLICIPVCAPAPPPWCSPRARIILCSSVDFFFSILLTLAAKHKITARLLAWLLAASSPASVLRQLV